MPYPAALLTLMVVMLTLLMIACAEMIQREDLVTVQTLAPSAHACAECHVAIHEEWADSAHAMAFTDEAFQRATLGARTEACLGCHVPESVIKLEGQPIPRSHLRDEGVTCIVCHLNPETQAMAGPLNNMGPVVPHAVEEGDARFLSSDICAICHVGTGQEAQAGAMIVDDSRTCQECHMTLVERRTTQATDLVSAGIVALHDTHTSRSHTFELGAVAEFPRAVNFDVTAGDQITVQAINNLPHPIPTGDFGHREVLLSALLVDESDQVLAQSEMRFTNRGNEGWSPGAVESLTLTPSPGTTPAGLRVALTRQSDQMHTPITLAQREYHISGQTVIPVSHEEVSTP